MKGYVLQPSLWQIYKKWSYSSRARQGFVKRTKNHCYASALYIPNRLITKILYRILNENLTK